MAAAPSSPAARIAGRQRFLLYDVIFHEQVNKQRRALMFYLDLAMKLKRTLVLPRPRLLRRLDRAGIHFHPVAEYVPWGELYNVSALAAVHPVMELDQYLALHGGVDLHVQISHQGCAPSDGAVVINFNGVADVSAAKAICHNRLQYDFRNLQQKYEDHESIAFSNSVDQLDMGTSVVLRQYVRFVDPIYEQAAAFVRDRFGGEPFLAIHWRRTDFLQVRRSHEWALQSAEMLIRHAKAAMRAHGLKHVYLATDSDEAAELRKVHAALPTARFAPPRAPTTLLARTVVANVEIAICAMAQRFFGTKTSSFSLAINEERLSVFGQTHESGGEMERPPEPDGKDEL